MPARHDVPPAAALFDLGAESARLETLSSARRFWKFQLRAEPALEDTAMRYRLAYARPDGAVRVLFYAYARWSAPPAELLRQRLERAFFWPPDTSVRDHCVLTLKLTSFEQFFVSPEESYGQMTVRAELWDSDKNQAADEAVFTESVPASAPDAAGGAQALAQGASMLAERIKRWRESAQDSAQKSCWSAAK
ncbi:MAG: ABC-type transport auxiliary lipoprotein family protein [Zoogloeaceae bacterium]|nr:ABC-type transport auxiliary lipoprotein family protein [Zoogloeaceae bacterium]